MKALQRPSGIEEILHDFSRGGSQTQLVDKAWILYPTTLILSKLNGVYNSMGTSKS